MFGLVVDEEQRVERVVALGNPIALEFLDNHLAESLWTDLIYQHLDPSPRAILAQPVLAIEDSQRGFGDP